MNNNQNLENLAEQTVFFFVLRLLRTNPLSVLNTYEIETISSNIQKVCNIDDSYLIDIKEIAIHALIRPNKYDQDYDKAQSYIETLFSDSSDEKNISSLKSWAEEVASSWKEFNLYPPDYPDQQDWDLLPSPNKINWKK